MYLKKAEHLDNYRLEIDREDWLSYKFECEQQTHTYFIFFTMMGIKQNFIVAVIAMLIISPYVFSRNDTVSENTHPYTDCISQKSSNNIDKVRAECFKNLEMNRSVRTDILNYEKSRIDSLPITNNKKNLFRNMDESFQLKVAQLSDEAVIKLSTLPMIDLLNIEKSNLQLLQILTKLDLKQLSKLLALPTNKLATIQTNEEAIDILSSFARKNINPDQTVRIISETEYETHERMYLNKKLEYLKMKKETLAIKVKLNQHKNEYFICQQNSKICTKEKDELIHDIRMYTLGILTLSTLQLEKIEQKLASSKHISTKGYEIASITIQDQITKLNLVKENINKDSSLDNLKQSVSDLSGLWDRSQSIAKLYATELLMIKVKDLVISSTANKDKISCLMVNAKLNNHDLADLRPLHSTYEEHLLNAQSMLINANDAINNLKNDEDYDLELIMIKTQTLESYLELSKAHLAFKSFVRHIQKIGIPLSTCDSISDDVSVSYMIQICSPSKEAYINTMYEEVCV